MQGTVVGSQGQWVHQSRWVALERRLRPEPTNRCPAPAVFDARSSRFASAGRSSKGRDQREEMPALRCPQQLREVANLLKQLATAKLRRGSAMGCPPFTEHPMAELSEEDRRRILGDKYRAPEIDVAAQLPKRSLWARFWRSLLGLT